MLFRSENRYEIFTKKKMQIEKEIERIKSLQVTNKKEIEEFLISCNSTPLKKPISLYELIKRPELDYFMVKKLDMDRPILNKYICEQVNIVSKYEGYIQKQLDQIKQFKKFESKSISRDINYDKIKGLRIEAMQKLGKIKPESIGQASRISGVSPADMSVLMIYLEQQKRLRNSESENKL